MARKNRARGRGPIAARDIAAVAAVGSFPAPHDLAARLSERRRSIIGAALENPRRHVLMSVRELAGELGSDPATTLRIVKAMGFRSYRDFQHYLHELSIAHATSLDRMRTAPSPGGAVAAIERCMDHDVENLAALRTGLDLARLQSVAAHLHEAERVVLFGGDLAISLVHYLESHLVLLGIACLAATTPGRSSHLARLLGAGDLAVGVSFGRGLRQTVEGLRQAKENGAYCVGITDTVLSPITRFSDEHFLATADTDSFTTSYTAPLALLNALLVACAHQRLGRTMELLEAADDEQRHGYRWYTEEGA